jgi:hypothetical protein
MSPDDRVDDARRAKQCTGVSRFDKLKALRSQGAPGYISIVGGAPRFDHGVIAV